MQSQLKGWIGFGVFLRNHLMKRKTRRKVLSYYRFRRTSRINIQLNYLGNRCVSSPRR